jgi:hypothetical protein
LTKFAPSQATPRQAWGAKPISLTAFNRAH